MFFRLHLPDDVICDIAIYADDTTFYSKWDQASDLLTTKIDFWTWIWLRDTVDCSRKWLNDFNAGKTQLVSLDRSDNTGGIDVKMDGSVLEKSSLTMLGLTFSSKLNWGSYIVTIASKKIEALIRSMKFFLLRLLCISINLPYAHAWNTVVTSRQVPLVTASNC